MSHANPHAHHRDKLLASWENMILLLRQAIEFSPGSVKRDDHLSKYFFVAEKLSHEVQTACTANPEKNYAHLFNKIMTSRNLIKQTAESNFDDNQKIEQSIVQNDQAGRSAIERLHRDSE